MVKNYINHPDGRLYGDHILLRHNNKKVLRNEIIKYHIPWRGSVTITTRQERWKIERNRDLLEWLNPAYPLKSKISATIAFSSSALLFAYLGLHQIPHILIFSSLAGLTSFYLQQTLDYPLKKTLKIIFLLTLFFALPTIYFFPFAWPIFLFYLILLSLIFIGETFFRQKETLQKYYIALTWTLITIFSFFWFSWSVKVTIDNKTATPSAGIIKIQDGQTRLQAGQNLWTPPPSWSLEETTWLHNITQRRNLIRQIAPLSNTAAIHLPIARFSGWVGVAHNSTAALHNKLMAYLQKQQKFLWAAYFNTEPLYSAEAANGLSSILVYKQNYFNLADMAPHTIFLFYIEDKTANQAMTWLFSLNLPENSSHEYYLSTILEGFQNSPTKR